MIDNNALFERLKIILEVTTQNDIAIYFDVSSKSVSEWKNGNTALPYQRLITLISEKNISFNWFFLGIGNKTLESNGNTSVNGVLNKQIGDNNSFYVKVDANILTTNKEELEQIASLLEFAPPAYINQVQIKLEEFKYQCLN